MTALLLFLLVASQAAPQTAAQPAESSDSAWTVLRDGLSDKSSDRRAKAVHALGLLVHDQRAQELAEKALSADSSIEVRAEGATALGQIGLRSSQKKLEEALKDNNLKTVVAAANSLYLFKNPAAYEIYYALLTGERKSPGLLKSQLDTLRDKKQMEQLMFQTGLGFVPFGGMGYQAWKTITRDDNSPIRAAAIEKLASDPDAKTTQALGRACSDSKWMVRMAVVEAIAKRGDPQLLYSVSPLIYDSNDDVRFEAAATVVLLSKKTPARRSRSRNAHSN
jgi:HEAT repeat protein